MTVADAQVKLQFLSDLERRKSIVERLREIDDTSRHRFFLSNGGVSSIALSVPWKDVIQYLDTELGTIERAIARIKAELNIDQ